MTIAAVLKAHGHHCARSVLQDGRLRFDIKSPTQNSVSMPLKSHTFHGGESMVEGATTRWWMDSETMDRERSAMELYFPEFVLMEESSNDAPAWHGTIRTSVAEYPILILHRKDHSLPLVVPYLEEARGRTVNGKYRRSPHLYDNGNLCVALQSDWDPQHDTAATVVGWAAHWHAVYQDWLRSGKWATQRYRNREVA